MKKGLFVTLIALTLLVWVFVSAAASAPRAQSFSTKPTHKNTPGAQATENAIRRATEGRGNQGGKKDRANYSGTIASADAGSLTLTLGDGSTVSFVIDASTRIQIPSLGRGATTDDLQEGAKARVRASDDGTGVLTAIFISVVPGKPEKIHRVGEVTEYSEGASITIADVDGNTYTFQIDENTKILPEERAGELKVGSRVTIICPRDVTGGELLAAGIVVHPETVEDGSEPVETEEPAETESPEVTETVETTEPPIATESPVP